MSFKEKWIRWFSIDDRIVKMADAVKQYDILLHNPVPKPEVRFSREMPASHNTHGVKYSDRTPYYPQEPLDSIRELIKEGEQRAKKKMISDDLSPSDFSFVVSVQTIIRQRNLKDSVVYRAAGIDRRLFSKMMSNIHYSPSKDTAIALALAFHLDLSDTNSLLAKAGYTLSHSIRRDVAIEYCINNNVYDIGTINALLVCLDLKMLGTP